MKTVEQKMQEFSDLIFYLQEKQDKGDGSIVLQEFKDKLEQIEHPDFFNTIWGCYARKPELHERVSVDDILSIMVRYI